MPSQLAAVDIAVITIYLLSVIAVGLLSLRRSNRGSTEGYFLAGGSMIWLPVGASLFASNIGSEHFVGLAGSGAVAGIGAAALELYALFFLQVLGWVTLPVYMAGGVYTMPDYLQKRLGGQRLRMYLACLSLMLYIFTKISVDLYSGGIFIQVALQWNLYPSILTLLGIVGVFTITGGLAAVMYTDTIQTFVMIIGACILSIFSFQEVGGYENMQIKYMQSYANETLYSNNSCGYPREDSFELVRAAVGSDLPWPGLFFGHTTASIWYWTTDQVIVQRTLAAKNLSHGQGGTLFAGLLKVLPLFIIVMPGMISRILFPDIVACASEETCYKRCGSKAGCSDLAYPLLVMEIMPAGLKGLLLAVMLSALISSLTSIFNSSSTIFTMDIWRNLRSFPSDAEMIELPVEQKKKYELELMIVGRTFLIGLIVVSVAWIPLVVNFQDGQLFVYIQVIGSNLVPPIAAIFLLAVLWHRLTEPGAFWALMIGLVTGLTRLTLTFVFPSPDCGNDDTRPMIVQRLLFHYMYFSLFLFWITVISAVVISLLTEPIPIDKIQRLTFWTRFSTKDRVEHGFPLTENSKTGTEEAHYSNLNKLNENEENGPLSGTTVESRDVAELPEKKKWRQFYDWFCGFSSNDTTYLTEEAEYQREQTIRAKIYQTRRDKIVLNSLLVLVLGLGVFMYSFFA